MDADNGMGRNIFLPMQTFVTSHQMFSGVFSPYENIAVNKVLFTCLGLLLGLYGYRQLKKRNLPPGPWAFPLIGWLGARKNIATMAASMQKLYGDIFMMKLGVHNFVFLTDYELIKSALNDKNLQGRTTFFTFKCITYNKNIGLINSEGEAWEIGRKFAMHSLCSLGLNKSNMQQYIQHEATKLLQHFQTLDGKPEVLGTVLNVAVLNVIWRLVANRRYEINDPDIKKFLQLLNEMVNIFEGPINLLNVLPWLRNLLPRALLNKLQVESLITRRDKIHDFTMKEIARHEKKLDLDDPKDYIDHYLKQIHIDLDNKDSHFSPDKMDLSASIIDLFFAGSETTSSTLRWFFLFMARHQDVQERIRNLLDEVVPRPILPSLEDKEKLGYLQAAILETMRLSSLIPQGLPHVATATTSVGGYTIPKGTIVTPCLEVCHKSPKYWERPTEFYPDHFLDVNGRVISRDGFMPFSLGPRRCLGESLARMELFLMAAIILQQFTVEEGPSFKSDFANQKRRSNLFNVPPEIELILKKRPA